MVILSENDYLEVKLNSLIADYDNETLANLYQPIIGYASLAVYFTLITEAKNQTITSVISHNQLLNRLQMAPGEFVDARKRLEGVGLLRTFLEEQNGTKIYHYQIFAPKTPSKFFDDALLYGMLIKAVGEVDSKRFKMIYHFEDQQTSGKDISSSFVDVYRPNFDDPAFMKALGGAQGIGRRSGKINSEFNYDAFFVALSEISQIKQDAFTKKDMKEIERLATLNGVGEEIAASIVSEIFNPNLGKGKHIDYLELSQKFEEYIDFRLLKKTAIDNEESKVTSSSAIANKINLMETAVPKNYLLLKQNGTRPAMSDLKIVSDLSTKYKLKNGVVNAVVDYVLFINNNILSRSLCEKIAASLQREGVTTAVDAMNYLKRASKHRKKGETPLKEIKATSSKQVESKKQKKEVNWDQLLDDLDDEGGDDNGKA